MATVGLMATVVACQPEEPEPNPSDTPPASAEPEPYATPEPTITTKPHRPTAADNNNPRGAIAFTQHYRELYEYATATGDWKPLKQATSNECDPCAELWNPQGHLETRGGQPPLITYSEAEWVKLSFMEKNPYTTATIKTPGGRWVETNRRKPTEVGPEEWSVRFYLDWKDDTWTVRDLEIREPHEKRELDYIW